MNISKKYFYPAGILLFLFVLQTSFLLFTDVRLLLDLIPDDAAYYFKIAENFNKGLGFTFDGLHQTNGFQPLWQYILIAFFFLLPSDPESFYRSALILQTIIVSLSALLLFRSVNKVNGEANAFIALGIMLLLVFSQAVNGMESAVVVFMLVVLFTYFTKDKFTSSDYFISGLITGLLILARLDFIFLPGFVFMFIIITSGLKNSLLYLSGCLLIFIPYTLNNYLHTGHSQPVSGVLKSSFPEFIFNFDLQFTAAGLVSIFSSISASVIYIIVRLKRLTAKYIPLQNHQLLITALSFTILLHYSFYLLFIKWPVLNYYFIFYGLVLAFITADLLRIKINRRVVLLFLLAAAGLIVVKYAWRLNKDLDNSWHAKAYDAALWTIHNTESGDVFAMKDAGNFSFVSSRRVINFDGLVNDLYFQDVLKDQKLKSYLKLNNVSYYVLYEASANKELLEGTYDQYRESFMSYKYMIMSDSLSISRESEVYRDTFNNSAFIIWKIN
jgi:hypothetical protein